MEPLTTASAGGRSRRLKFLSGLVGLALVLGLGVSTVFRAGPHQFGDRTWGSLAHRTDFTVYREAGLAVWNGTNIYEVQNIRGWMFSSLPIFAVFMMPFALVSVFWGALIWYALSVVMVGASARLAARLARQVIPACPVDEFWLMLLAVVLTLPLTMSGITRGQPSLLVMLLVTLTVVCHRQQRDWLAGFCLVGAIAIKVFPGLLIVYFLLKRKFRMLAATAVWAVVLLLVVPSATFGIRGNFNLLRQWYHTVAVSAFDSAAQGARFQQTFDTRIARNQSVKAIVTRWYARCLPTNLQLTERSMTGNHIAMGINLALLAIAAWSCGRGGGRIPEPARTVLQLCTVIPLALFVSPVAWNHYYTVLVIPLTVGAGFALAKADSPSRRIFRWGVGGWVVLSVLSLTAPLNEWGALLGASLLLWLSFVWLLSGQFSLDSNRGVPTDSPRSKSLPI